MITASHTLSKNNIMTMPTAIQNMANPHIFFMIPLRFLIKYVEERYSFYIVYVTAFCLVHKSLQRACAATQKSCFQHFAAAAFFHTF